MDDKKILNYLRNPYGLPSRQMQETRLAAADSIEKWKEAYENMRDFAVSKGLDVTTRGQAYNATDKRQRTPLEP